MTFAADLKAALVASGASAASPLTDSFANGFATAILLWAGSGGGGGLSAPVHLTSQVDQILPVANGGTGSATAPAGGFAGLTALGAETTARVADVDAEEAARIAAVSAEASTRSAADSAESAARIAADSAESAARIAADSAETSARIADVDAEEAARIAADASAATTAATATAAARAASAVYEISLAAGLQTITSTTFTRCGARAVDLSKYPTLSGYTRHVRLVADVDKTPGATSGTVQLFDATHNVVVTGTGMTTTSVDSEEKDSGDLTVGTASGNIRTDAARYELQMKRTGGVEGTDAVYLTNARLYIYYT